MSMSGPSIGRALPHAFLGTLILASCASSSPVIVTFAGDGQSKAAGDGGPATSASIADPQGVFVDRDGNVYIISESAAHQVRRVDGQTGVISTFAGTGEEGYSGDDGPAVDAMLANPHGGAVDAAGNVYLTNVTSSVIRRIDGETGVITTFAGTGESGFAGDGGPAVEAELNGPSQLTFDGAGNLYVSEYYGARVRKIDTEGVITTVAGNGRGEFSGDGGPAVEAGLFIPDGLAVDAAGNLYITEFAGHRIRRIDAAGVITTVAGTGISGYSGDGGKASEAKISAPHALAFDAAGNLWFTDAGNHVVRRIDAEGTISTVVGSGEGGYAGDAGIAEHAKLFRPMGLAFDAAGNLYIAEALNYRIRKVTWPAE